MSSFIRMSLLSLFLRINYRASSLRYNINGVRRFRMSGFNTSNRKDKIIDAEIVGGKTPTRIRSVNKQDEPDNNNSIISGILNKVGKVFGLDSESRMKRERKKAINSSIDKMMEGSGIMGAVLGTVMKSVGGLVSDSIAETGRDVENVQVAVENALDSDSSTSTLLGVNIRCGAPFSTSIGSMSINGVTTKSVSLVMEVSGSDGSGQVQVKASLDGSARVTIEQLVFQSGNGKVINIKGGGGGGGGRRTVIDVETV